MRECQNFLKNLLRFLKKNLVQKTLVFIQKFIGFTNFLSKKHHLSKKHFIAIAGIDAGLRNCIELFEIKKLLFWILRLQ